jgi:hypothetical protein
MNVGQAMIIKTNSHEQTELVQKLREVVKATGNDIVLVPHNVNYLYITIDKGELTVFLPLCNDRDEVRDLDVVKGFDSVAECWEYARIVMSEAGLPDDSCDACVWDAEEE